MEQPSVTGDGDTKLTSVFWGAVIATGIASGLFGALLMLLLFNVVRGIRYHSGSFEAGVEAASATRRMVTLLIAGAFGGVAWYLLRRYTVGERPTWRTSSGTATGACHRSEAWATR